MGKLRLPRTLAFVALGSVALALAPAGCSGGGGGDSGCVPERYYDDGGMVPPDALPRCPQQPDKNGNCPSGCQPVV